MEVKEKEVWVKDYLTKSNLPDCDDVINPYVGCPNACKYCYASFMKRFTGHSEPWGSFVDIKNCDKPIKMDKLKGKSVFLASVTDCYNSYEEKYQKTRKIISQLVDAECEVTISTKSKLILRDLDLLKQFKNLKAAMSVNTLDETFRKNMDQASTIDERLDTLKRLHEAGIYTVLFMSPIFPYLTEWEQIIEKTHAFIKEYWFENLNLRGSYKRVIMDYIKENHPELTEKYAAIYDKKQKAYWETLAEEMELYCKVHQIVHINYFYHEALVKEKLKSKSDNISQVPKAKALQ